MTEDRAPWLTLGSSEIRARINPLGAQLSSLQDREGRELLWNGDPAVWSGRAPLLFPIVGALAGGRYRVGPDQYSLPRHGFARNRPFEVIETREAQALLRLTSDQATLDVYPFPFELTIRFELRSSTLALSASIRNTGSTHLPASFGFHPAFRWPLPYGRPRERHAIEFALEEPAPVRRLDADGLLSNVRHPTPIHQRRLPLEDALFTADAIILDQVRSRQVIYGADTGPRIAVRFPDSPYLGLWTKPGAPFVCIEPWNGYADPQGFDQDFFDKPGLMRIAPGATTEIPIDITLT